MYPPAPPARKKVVAAVTLSVLVHGLVGLAWWATADRCAVAAPMSGTTVDGPEERETIFVLRDPPGERPRPAAPPVAITAATIPPGPLPETVVRPGPKSLDSGARVQPGISPAGDQSLPKSGQATPLHGALAPGRSIVYVLDRSASMGPDGLLQRAVAAIRASVQPLGPDVRFGIVAYNGKPSSLAPALLTATPENVGRAAAWLAGLGAEGGSNHPAGMLEGLSLRPDGIVLLTDADDLDEADVYRIARAWRRPVRLDVVVFGSRRPTAETPLDRFVRQVGGSIRYRGD